MESPSVELSNNALIIMDPSHSEGDSNILLLKDMMLDEQEQQCVLEVYSEAPNEFDLPGLAYLYPPANHMVNYKLMPILQITFLMKSTLISTWTLTICHILKKLL